MILPTPKTGYKWQQTFNDDFDGTTIDVSKWRGGYSHLQWCNDGKCANTYSGIKVRNGVLELQPTINTTDFSKTTRAMVHSGGLNAADAKFSQMFGFFVARMKMPKHAGSKGYWHSFWCLPLEKTNQDRRIPPKEWEEIDIQESWYDNDIYQTHFDLHDTKLNAYTPKYPIPTVGDLANEYHDYGLLWRDNGTRNGTMQPYFDGIPQGTPYQLSDTSPFWEKGIYIILQATACHTQADNVPVGAWNYETCKCDSTSSINNPMFIDYVKVYKEVTNGTPIPKYKCVNGVCTRDDVNGTYLTSNCDNICTPSPPNLTCQITSCPPTNILLNEQTNISASCVGGTAPYSAQLIRDGVAYGSLIPVTGNSITIPFQAVNTWIGTHTVAVKFIDSSTPQKICSTSVCNITVTQPKYKCLNGVCTRDDVNGTYLTSNCDNACQPTCPTPICNYTMEVI